MTRRSRTGTAGALAAAVWWSSAVTLAMTYAVLPGWILLRGALVHRPHRRGPVPVDPELDVAVVVAAKDAAGELPATVTSVLDQIGPALPAERVRIVLASDGSTDGTVAVARALAERARSAGVSLEVLDLPWRGKAAALEDAVAAAGLADLLVFTDAGTVLAPGSLVALLAPFADPEVGAVAGDQRYLPPSAGGAEAGTAAGERGHWSLDRVLKIAEGRAGSVVSATGALHAIRRELFDGVRPDSTDDFWISTGAIARGRRLVFAPDAVAWEPVAGGSGAELGRKVRVMTRGLTGVAGRRELLDPRRHGAQAVVLLWHKVLRRLFALPLLVLLVSGTLAWRRSWLYRASSLAGLSGVALGVVGLRRPGRTRLQRLLTGVPAYVLLVGAASISAVRNVATGRTIERWTPTGSVARSGADGPRSGAAAGH